MNELLAPNGKPSNLTPEQYKLVRNPAFKKWFGDWENDPANSSKVIDEETKEPLVVYHGTDYEFNEFKNFKDIHFFTQSENEAYWFVNEHKIIKDKKDIVIKKCFLNIRKIFNGDNVSDLEKQKITNIINNVDDLDDLYLGGDYLYYKKEFGKEKLSDIDYILFLLKSSSNYMVLEQDVFINWFMKEKYNGFIVTEYGFNKKNYAVFNSNQIKLADGTNTTFDSGNPDIRFNDGGLIAPNGKSSGLYFTEIYNLVRTKEFKEWFGDWEEAYITKDYEGVSKIIDDNGEPLICVHNTRNEFYEFDEYEIGKNTDAGFYGRGFYFTPNIGQPNYGEIELNCFLNIKNPHLKQSSHRNYELNSDDLKDKNYDGVIVYPNWITDFNFENGVDGCEEIITYYSEQIKLGDGTNTTFDLYNPDIRFDGGGEIEKYEIGGVYQGTPNDFDKYSTEYMGTGEGKQVFGWGLYFTNIKDIAKTYAKNDALIYKEIQKKEKNSELSNIYRLIPIYATDRLKYLKDKLKQFELNKLKYKKNTWDRDIDSYKNLIKIIENYKGNIYSATLFKGENEDDYKLIEWEKSLIGEEFIKTLQSLKKFLNVESIDFDDSWDIIEKEQGYVFHNKDGKDLTWKDIYIYLSNQLDGDKEASLFLLREGIDGIKYKAGTLSNFDNSDGYNYVIFDANDVTIERKEKYADGGEVNKIKNLFLENGFTEDELNRIVEENENYFNQIEFYDNETLIVYRTIALPKRLVEKFIKLDKKEIGDGIGEYWTLDKDFGRAVWGGGHYEKEETFDTMCKGHLKIKDIDWEMMKYAYNDDPYNFGSESEIRGVDGGNSIKVIECSELVYRNGGEVKTGLFAQIWEWFGIKF